MTLNTKKYYKRDLSWLRFNHRVLQEAADKSNPLYERVKFLAIFSSNLDEFFKVRVSDIRKIKTLDKPLRKKLITKPNKLLKAIKEQVHLQQEEFGEIYTYQIIPELKNEGIVLIDHLQFNPSQIEFIEKYYRNNIASDLISTTVDTLSYNEEVALENEQLYLVSSLKNGNLIIVKIPTNLDRFISLPKQDNTHFISFIDDVLKYNLSKEFGDAIFYAIKISRDAELYIDDEYSGNLLQKIKKSLSNRITGQITRLLIDSKMPSKILEKLVIALDVNETDIVYGGTYHNFKDFFGFPNPTNKNLSIEQLSPVRDHKLLNHKDIFTAIRKKDRLYYYPYESFDQVLYLLKSASEDSKVTKIKITLYRISKDSNLGDLLIKAAENGKEVLVFIETKARFDEVNNIKWGSKLEKAGATVLYSYPGIKVHSKILYVERIEEGSVTGYGYISTGNFNEKTAEIYTDFGLITANPKITNELLQVFQVLDRSIIIPKTKKLLVSPFNTRNRLKKLILKEIENSKKGEKSYIILKLNNLQDHSMIDLLYQASNAGVEIQLIVRGICCLIPGIKGQSENIRITSIIDRFLEHARVYIFANGGKEKMYIGSADWMTRNLDHRIEVITPILDKDVFLKIKRIIRLQLNDNVKSRIIDEEQINSYIRTPSKNIRAQEEIFKMLNNYNSIEEKK